VIVNDDLARFLPGGKCDLADVTYVEFLGVDVETICGNGSEDESCRVVSCFYGPALIERVQREAGRDLSRLDAEKICGLGSGKAKCLRSTVASKSDTCFLDVLKAIINPLVGEFVVPTSSAVLP
jgi:hypothetical protein